MRFDDGQIVGREFVVSGRYTKSQVPRPAHRNLAISNSPLRQKSTLAQWLKKLFSDDHLARAGRCQLAAPPNGRQDDEAGANCPGLSFLALRFAAALAARAH